MATGHPQALQAGLEDFLESLRVEAGLSRNTLLAYRRDVERFMRALAESGVRRWQGVKTEHLIDHPLCERSRDP